METITDIQIVVMFKIDQSIVFTLGDSIKKFQAETNAQVQMLNTPSGARPEAPRVIIATDAYIINISLNRFDIILKVPTHINRYSEKVLTFCFQSMETIFDILIRDKIEYMWGGVIFTIHYPFDKKQVRALKLLEPVFDKLLKIERKGRSLATFNLQYGYQDQDYYINYTINGYEVAMIKIPIRKEGKDAVDVGITADMIDEAGIEIRLDINNKPVKEKTNCIDDFSMLLNKVEKTLKIILEETGLEEVISG
jgi:hypothetical protein